MVLVKCVCLYVEKHMSNKSCISFFYEEITAILQPKQITACRKYIRKYVFVAFQEKKQKKKITMQKNEILVTNWYAK